MKNRNSVIKLKPSDLQSIIREEVKALISKKVNERFNPNRVSDDFFSGLIQDKMTDVTIDASVGVVNEYRGELLKEMVKIMREYFATYSQSHEDLTTNTLENTFDSIDEISESEAQCAAEIQDALVKYADLVCKKIYDLYKD